MSNQPKELKNDSTYTVREVKAGHGQNTTPVPDKECSINSSVKE